MENTIKNIAKDYMEFHFRLKQLGLDLDETFYGKGNDKRKFMFNSLLDFTSSSYINFNKNLKTEDKLSIENFLIELKKQVYPRTSMIFRDGTPLGILKTIINKGHVYLNEQNNLTLSKLSIDNISTSSLRHAVLNSKYGTNEGIIDREGNYYPVKCDHRILIHTLIGNGVNLHGAVRVSHREKTISLSSLNSFFTQDEHFHNEKTIIISTEQANTIVNYYEASKVLFLGKIQLNLKEIIFNSENLGWDKSVRANTDFYSNNILRANIETLFNAVILKYGKDSYTRRDLDLLSLEDELITMNNQNLSAVISKINTNRNSKDDDMKIYN